MINSNFKQKNICNKLTPEHFCRTFQIRKELKESESL